MNTNKDKWKEQPRKNLVEGENELNATHQPVQDVSDIPGSEIPPKWRLMAGANETRDGPSKSLKNVTQLQNFEATLTSAGCGGTIHCLDGGEEVQVEQVGQVRVGAPM